MFDLDTDTDYSETEDKNYHNKPRDVINLKSAVLC